MATKTDKTTAEELRALIKTGLWAGHYERCRTGGADKLISEAGRFRDALRAGGIDVSVEEIRISLLEHAGLVNEIPSVGVAGAAPASGDEPADDRRAKDAPHESSGAESPVEPTVEKVDGARESYAGNSRVASWALHRLYSGGVRLELRDGELHAERDVGLTDEQRVLLEDHREGLKRLLSEEAMSEVWSSAVHYIAKALGDDVEGARYERATGFLDAAQDAYQEDDHGLCRYELRRAAEAARGGTDG